MGTFTRRTMVAIAIVTLAGCGKILGFGSAPGPAAASVPPAPSHFPMLAARFFPRHIQRLAFGDTQVDQALAEFPVDLYTIVRRESSPYAGIEMLNGIPTTSVVIAAKDGISPFGPNQLDRIRLAFAQLPNRTSPTLVGAQFDQHVGAPNNICSDLGVELAEARGRPCVGTLQGSRSDFRGWQYCAGDVTGQLPLNVKCSAQQPGGGGNVLQIAVAITAVSPQLPAPPLPLPPPGFRAPPVPGQIVAAPPPPPLPPPAVVPDVLPPMEPGILHDDLTGWRCTSGTHAWTNIDLHATPANFPTLRIDGDCNLTCTHCTFRNDSENAIGASGNSHVTLIDSTIAGASNAFSLGGRAEVNVQQSRVTSSFDFAIVMDRSSLTLAGSTFSHGTVNAERSAHVVDSGGNTGLTL